MSKLWLYVQDTRTNRVVKEVPVTLQTLTSERTKLRQQYPIPQYTIGQTGSSQSTATATENLKGWDTEGFKEHNDLMKQRGRTG